ncbi:CcdB family protein [Luteibacter aegosomatissinici]|uniref:CcdB family protein n=1 Tax=Luteibacter aegosomatissinici TaxID=2911539 RepID=UPI001FFB4206|nr:CcdB family protein [Luteibacter aegosomatissinici]UPG94141.1 CcdB family protein [Luteibacter aegosomatissinici]
MAQFDIHANPGKLRQFIPFVVVIQSAAFDHSDRRVVAPLIHAKDFGRVFSKRFNPTFIIDGAPVVLQPLEIVSIPKTLLGAPLATLKHEGQAIVDALDELTSQAYG